MQNDLISRTELIQKLNCWDNKAHGIPNYAWKVIRELPSVKPKKGKWTRNLRMGFHQCSNCGKFCDFDYLYCPNCGAKMEEEG